jgi:hypothetical protein
MLIDLRKVEERYRQAIIFNDKTVISAHVFVTGFITQRPSFEGRCVINYLKTKSKKKTDQC